MNAPRPPKILIVEARFYPEISDQLMTGARRALEAAGAEHDIIQVPGAMEIPAAIRFAEIAAQSGERPAYDGYLPLGCVVRGGTSHYDYVCQMCMTGIQRLVEEFAIAVGVGVLTVENREQAVARASVEKGDKGGNAAQSCLAMIEHKQSFGIAGPITE